LYVFGGYTNSKEPGVKKYVESSEKMSFSDGKHEWKMIAPMAVPRSGAFSWVDKKNKKIYVAGGIKADDNQVLNTTEIYDVATNTWTQGRKFKLIFYTYLVNLFNILN
jgi:Galactose oxidase, central domain